MTREQAADAFGTTFVIAWCVAIGARAVDAPRGVERLLGFAMLAALAPLAGIWLLRAIQDGSLVKAAPDYAWGFVSLVLIAAACGLVTLLVLLVLGEPVTSLDVSSGAAGGTFLVLAGFWIRRGLAARRERRLDWDAR